MRNKVTLTALVALLVALGMFLRERQLILRDLQAATHILHDAQTKAGVREIERSLGPALRLRLAEARGLGTVTSPQPPQTEMVAVVTLGRVKCVIAVGPHDVLLAYECVPQ